jgi:CheY-like chemotaxis protein
MGGQIRVESEPGRGSTFHVTLRVGLPRDKTICHRIAASDGLDNVRALVVDDNETNLRILLAEDSLVNQKLAVALLERHGHDVRVVNNGREAIAAVESDEYDLVLMDVQMPKLDGFEATAAIRAREKDTGRHIPIVAMTAHALKGDRELCLESGMDEYISKPIRAASLFRTIQRVVDPSRFQTPEHDSPTVVNWDEALDALGGDREILKILTESVVGEAPVMLDAVQQAVRAGDPSAVRIAAHTLKGAVRYFGATAVYNSALRLESMGRDGDLEKASEVLASLEKSIEQLLAALALGRGDKDTN